MNKNISKPLYGWTITTLWFKQGIGDLNPLEFKLWTHPNCSNKDYIKQIEEASHQIVSLIWQLTGHKKMIIQGQFQKKINK